MPSRKPNDADADADANSDANGDADANNGAEVKAEALTDIPVINLLTDERQNNSARKTTLINGIGLWHSWTRNFKSPLLALLDLLDNAFDAGFSNLHPGFKSKIHIYQDEWISPQSNFTETTKNPFGNCVTGMVIANNSAEPICDISSILQVYKSAKSDCETIGENGVGLKQGCATISDLSFVLIRSDDRMAIGVVAKGLQHAEGAYLPSYPLDLGKDVKKQLEKIFTVDDPEVGQCAAVYGFGDLKIAIERLEKHVDEMCNSSEWGDEQYCFRLIVDKIRYRNAQDMSQETALVPIDDGDSYRHAVCGLMNELSTVLPSQYIHIPECFDVRIGMEKVYFNYWQCRLAELSVFYVKIDPDNSFTVSDDWKEPSFGYHIRVFVGFDPIRFVDAEDTKNDVIKTCSLHLYSRQSGRLIRHETDARSLLSLQSGGTNYCQGLTVIVDDFAGQLPLNPTKQDVAFSEQSNGQVHERNLYSWIHAIASGYYSYILNFFHNRKTDLSVGVKSLYVNMRALFDQRCEAQFKINSLAKANYTSYTKDLIPFRKIANKILCAQPLMTTSRIEGSDTKFRLFSQAEMIVKQEEEKQRKDRVKRVITTVTSPRKRVRVQQKQIISTPMPEPVLSSNNSRYPNRRRQLTRPLISTSSATIRLTEESESEIEDTTPPALSESLKKEAGMWKNVAAKQIQEQESWKSKARKETQEKESWKHKAEKQVQETDTWKTRARLLKQQYTDKKAYYEDLLKRKEEELAFYKNKGVTAELGATIAALPAPLSLDGDTDSSDDHGGCGRTLKKTESDEAINVG